MPELPRKEDGTLEHYAWPGGYQILYLDKENSVLCPDCANKSEQDPDEVPHFKPVAAFIHCEGDTEYCDQCNAMFDSEYGNPDEKEEEK